MPPPFVRTAPAVTSWNRGSKPRWRIQARILYYRVLILLASRNVYFALIANFSSNVDCCHLFCNQFGFSTKRRMKVEYFCQIANASESFNNTYKIRKIANKIKCSRLMKSKSRWMVKVTSHLHKPIKSFFLLSD